MSHPSSSRISKRASDQNRANAAAKKAARTTKSESHHPATAAHIDYSDDDMEFQRAYTSFQARTGKRFPSLKDTLAIVRSLGYVKQSHLLSFDMHDMEMEVDIRDFGSMKPMSGGAN